MHAYASICRTHSQIFPFQSPPCYLLPRSLQPTKNPNFLPTSNPTNSLLLSKSFPDPSHSNSLSLDDSQNDLISSESELATGNGVEIKVEKAGKNRRRIRSRIGIDASLDTIWSLLTDFERLPDFIPGLAVCELLERKENFARLFQIGQQNLAFGLKFNAKGTVECYEKDLVHLPFGRRRDIEFKMIEGDFQTFEGKWSIVQADDGRCGEENEASEGKKFESVLWYVVDVQPKLWLPVRLVEGRLCEEIGVNLACIREEAHRVVLEGLGSCQ